MPGLTRRPVKGDRLWYRGESYGVVTSVDGNLCWALQDGTGKSEPFIWYFPRDGAMNALFITE